MLEANNKQRETEEKFFIKWKGRERRKR